MDKLVEDIVELTAEQLTKIMPQLPDDKLAAYLPHLNKVMAGRAINANPLRASAFLAQLAHESCELKYMEEIWGPTKQQRKYEPPHDVARKLGNTRKGDGFRFRGRGPIQVTGRANYRNYGTLLGVDLENNPDLASQPEYGFALAGLYWHINSLNPLADVGNFVTITKRINGGINGLEERERYYAIAKEVLGIVEVEG